MERGTPFVRGFVGFFGLPNRGKSTLLNNLMKRHSAIISRRPHTTVESQPFLWHLGEDVDVVGIDTPGFQTRHSRLWGRQLHNQIQKSLIPSKQYLALFLVDITEPDFELDISCLQTLDAPKIWVIFNKIDRVPRNILLARSQAFHSLGGVDKFFMISAKKSQGISALKRSIFEFFKTMEPFPWPMEAETKEAPIGEMARHFVREQMFQTLRMELPYETSVIINSVTQTASKGWKIHISLQIQRLSHKKIIIGKRGQNIKMLRERATRSLEKAWGSPCHLFLHVTLKGTGDAGQQPS